MNTLLRKYAVLTASILAIGAVTAFITEHAFIYIILKPVPALLLALNCYKPNYSSNWRRKMSIAFLFCAAGDVALSFQTNGLSFFISGLVFFLIAQILFSTVFFRANPIFEWRNTLYWTQFAGSTFILVYGVEFFVLNHERFGSLQLLVLIYCIAITFMGITAVLRNLKMGIQSYFLILTGALLFIASDSLLAAEKFIYPGMDLGFPVLISYYGAIILMSLGMEKSKSDHSN